MKVLVGWEDQGSRHTGGGGMADKGAEGTGGRQVSRMQSGERGGRAAGTKNSAKFYPVTIIRKNSIWICSRQNQKGRQKAQDVKHTYISPVGIYV